MGDLDFYSDPRTVYNPGMERNPFVETPRESPRERRDRLVEDIMLREALLGDIRKRLDGITAEAEPEEIERVLTGIRSTARTTMGKAVCAKLARLRDLIAEANKPTADFGPDTDYTEANERKEAVHEEIEGLWEMPDVTFLESVEQLVKMLRAKSKSVQALRHDRPKTIIALNRRQSKDSSGGKKLTAKIRSEDITDINYAPFEIIVTLDTRACDRIRQASGSEAAGWHLSHSPFSLIDAGEPDQADIRHHESVHNLLDSQEFSLERSLSEVFASFKKSELSTNPDFFKEMGRQVFMDNPPVVCLDRLKSEILANLEAAEHLDFGVRRGKTHGWLAPTDWRMKAWESFSTAGLEYHDFLENVLKFSHETPDQKLKEYLRKLAMDLESLFLNMARDLDTAFGTAKRLPESEAAHDTLTDLCLMLKPSQYSHLTGLLGEKFGAEACRSIADSVRFSRAIQSQDWKALSNLEVPAELHPTDRRLILDSLEKTDPQEAAADVITGLEISSLAEYRRLTRFYSSLEQTIGRNPGLDRLKKSTSWEFFYKQAQADMLDGLKTIIGYYPDLDATEKDALREGLDSYIDEGLFGDDLHMNMAVEEIEDWSREFDWRFIEQLGLKDKLQRVISFAIKQIQEEAAHLAAQSADKKDTSV